MLSYTTDGGATYETKKIRLADLIDDFQAGDLADVDGTISPSNGQALVWNAITSMWNPDTVSGGGGIPEAPQDGQAYLRQDVAWVDLAAAMDAINGRTIDGGDLETGTSAGDGTTIDGGVIN